MRELRLGVVGANKQGREHLVAAPGVRVVAACDVSPDVRAALRRDYPDLPCHDSLQEMCATEGLDGLIVAVPHHVVPELWPEILAAGLPVLKEKPLGRTLAEAHQLLGDARRARVPVVTAIQRRNHPSYLYLAERLATADVRALSATLHLGFDPTRGSAGWRAERQKAGGGALLDSGYHMVDLAQHLLGPLTFVHANLWCLDRPAGPDDMETDAVLLARAGATWVRIESRLGGRPDPERPGRYRKYERIEVETDVHRYAADRSGVWEDAVQVYACPPDWRDGMALQLETFAARIRDGRFDTALVWDQVAAMRVISRAYAELDRFGGLPAVWGT